MTGAKAKKSTDGKQAEVKPPKRRLPWFAWLFIAVAIAGVVVLVRTYPMGRASPDNLGKPRAAIVDQLYNLQPNETLLQTSPRSSRITALQLTSTRVITSRSTFTAN